MPWHTKTMMLGQLLGPDTSKLCLGIAINSKHRELKIMLGHIKNYACMDSVITQLDVCSDSCYARTQSNLCSDSAFTQLDVCSDSYYARTQSKLCLDSTITQLIVTITKFSILIGSARAYLSRYWRAITWVSNHRYLIWTNFKLDTCNWTPSPFARQSRTLKRVFSCCFPAVCTSDWNPWLFHKKRFSKVFQSRFFFIDTINW